MMNLHAIAARAIGAVHPNQELVLVRCLGSVNESGLLLGQFGSCEAVTAQVQKLSVNLATKQNRPQQTGILSSQSSP